MAKRPGPSSKPPNLPAIDDYRHGGPPPHGVKRKNVPPAGMASEAAVPIAPKVQYSYNPHLPPVLRFDSSAKADAVNALAAKVRSNAPLTTEDRAVLAAALARNSGGGEPWLEWTGKREKKWFEVDPVALHIHERISAQAILKVAARQDVSKSLFADPQQEYNEAVQFYRHDIDWTNRLILGDSLQVMSSLAKREDLAGKVQMIYMDPPYGIKFASNFQPEVGKRDVKEKPEDLTREPEMVRAYRDTWHLGIHSYLSYLRDRLIVAKELLADTGSIFVQISDENLHRVRLLLDEVFGVGNHIVDIVVKKKGSQKGGSLEPINDFLLWYVRDRSKASIRQVFRGKATGEDGPDRFDRAERSDGSVCRVADDGSDNNDLEDGRLRLFAADPLTSGGEFRTQLFPVKVQGREFRPPPNNSWKLGETTMARVVAADRIVVGDTGIRFKKFLEDFDRSAMTNFWDDLAGATEKVYVVQTNAKIIERCLLMTTDPGDLVLDPTCGSGTTAYVAEQCGRRWITTDTSRVAIAIARQRLLTAKFEQFKTKASDTGGGSEGQSNPALGFVYKTVPHITLKSIAQNVALDPIFAKHQPILDKALELANHKLGVSLQVHKDLAAKLAAKLALKEQREGKRTITEADRRRWLLPPANRDKSAKLTVDAAFKGWYHWEVPFDTDNDYPKELAAAITAYRAAWRAKMDDVNACIAASAEQEELVDQPEIVRGVVRVTGPFSVESVQPPELSLTDEIPLAPSPAPGGGGGRVPEAGGGGFAGAPPALDGAFTPPRFVEPRHELEVANVSAYLDHMLRNLKADGVRFLNNRRVQWTRLEPLYNSGRGGASPFHAEGRWVAVDKDGKPKADDDPEGPANVAVLFGPQYGSVTVEMVEPAMRKARKKYQHLVVVAFSFQPEAVSLASDDSLEFQLHFAQVAGDVNPGMNGLLKEPAKPGGGSLFAAIGLPRINVRKTKEDGKDMFEVTMEGLDIYNPASDSLEATDAGKVAAWFLDGDYDGRTFCITQAFFPDQSAWEKLSKALNGKDGLIDAERFAALSGTTSLPFPAGKHKTVAVKVIDPRGNEVMAVEPLA